jgi:hypothetical protein
LALLTQPFWIVVSYRTLPVSRSDKRMRQGPPASGAATRAPKLKSKRSLVGPSWVGNSAGGVKCGFGGGSGAAEAVPAAEATGFAPEPGSFTGSGAAFGGDSSDEFDKCPSLTVSGQSEVAGHVAA